MTDLNKQWAELEGWNPKGERFIEQNNKIYGYAPRLGKWPLPNWTEPNRFFAEVVPRMRELGMVHLEFPRNTISGDKMKRCTIMIQSLNNTENWLPEFYGSGETDCVAGLTAAIQARKELGND